MLAVVQAMLDHSGIKCMLNGLSSTVVFERPKDEAFVRKWQLACEVPSPAPPPPPHLSPHSVHCFLHSAESSNMKAPPRCTQAWLADRNQISMLLLYGAVVAMVPDAKLPGSCS